MDTWPPDDTPVWYVAYASNMWAERFRCYLAGGTVTGARRVYTGCRDRSLPARDIGFWLDGRLRFAGESRVWGGGMAFYRHDLPGRVAVRAYLVTFGQFADVVAQETRHPVGTALRPRTGPAVAVTAADGVYETVLHVGDREGVPLLTLSSVQHLDLAAPSTAYVRAMDIGLAETFGWSAGQRAAYLLEAEGMVPAWSLARLTGVSSGPAD